MPISVTSSDSGIETAVTRVDRTEARNTRITSTANPSPRMPSCTRVWMDCSMNGAWSKTTVMAASEPSWASSSGTSSRTAWETETVSASGVLVTARPRVSTPSVRVIEVATSSASSTVASSPNSTPAAGGVGAAGDCCSSGRVGAAPPSGADGGAVPGAAVLPSEAGCAASSAGITAT